MESAYRRMLLRSLIAALLGAVAASAGSGTIAIDARRPGPRIPSSLYGIFFEEISHAGEGGLYAELIQHRGFEDANLPPACRLEDGFLIPPRTPHYWQQPKISDWRMRWLVTSQWPAWSLAATGGSAAALELVDTEPLNPATPHSLQVAIGSVAPAGRVAVLNEGFWGISVRQGEEYRLTFYARAGEGFRGPITASLESKSGQTLASTVFRETPPSLWRKYEARLKASGADPQARLALSFGSAGKVWLDFVSLFPVRTFRNRRTACGRTWRK